MSSLSSAKQFEYSTNSVNNVGSVKRCATSIFFKRSNHVATCMWANMQLWKQCKQCKQCMQCEQFIARCYLHLWWYHFYTSDWQHYVFYGCISFDNTFSWGAYGEIILRFCQKLVTKAPKNMEIWQQLTILLVLMYLSCPARAQSAGTRRARALRAQRLLLADGALTLERRKTFWCVGQAFY